MSRKNKKNIDFLEAKSYIDSGGKKMNNEKQKGTDYKGIDYGCGKANIDKNNIRYGIISQNECLEAWCDTAKPDYGPDREEWTEEEWVFAEVISYYIDDDEYCAESDEYGDIMIMRSPYFTYAQFCSPCVPGACYLINFLSEPEENNRAYCFGHDWFEDGIAPYPVYSVKTGKLIRRKKND